LRTRTLGPFTVSQIGFGCMGLSHGYGGRSDRAGAEAVLNKALDLGITLIDTAAVYGMGHNESLVGEALKGRRQQFILASKGGLYIKDGRREIDGRPERLRQSVDISLQRLQTEVIDLYYLHRLDPNVPIEDSVGELARAVQAGKIRAIGLSEMSAATLRRAHAIHPIAALQTEYSLWTRNPEIAVLEACRQIGAAFIAFSPLARGFLTAAPPDNQAFKPGDIRAAMPRFQGADYQANLKLLEPLGALAREAGCSLAQLALAWVLAQGEHLIALPGTGKLNHLAENAGADGLSLSAEVLEQAGKIINQTTVHGPRYNASNQLDVDTEEFAA
jgi:aryl-alcohol dehydrogenase-like predicted oxidoreductase